MLLECFLYFFRYVRLCLVAFTVQFYKLKLVPHDKKGKRVMTEVMHIPFLYLLSR